MEAEELAKIIRESLNEKIKDKGYITSMLCYDPTKMQYKVSFRIMSKSGESTYKNHFNITVDDVTKNDIWCEKTNTKIN